MLELNINRKNIYQKQLGSTKTTNLERFLTTPIILEPLDMLFMIRSTIKFFQQRVFILRVILIFIFMQMELTKILMNSQ